MTIVVNDKWSVEKDTHQWQVHERRQNMNNKTKKMVESTKTSYYPRLDQCLLHIADQESGEVETIEELIEHWKELEDQIKRAISRTNRRRVHSEQETS